MVSAATSSLAGAALGIRQGLEKVDFGTKALSQAAEQQQSVATLIQGGVPGGNVTETRGQNLNIVV